MKRKTKVVIRMLAIFKKWYICHATSYQNAFSSDVNGFDTRQEAYDYAISNGCKVMYHPNDQFQKYTEKKPFGVNIKRTLNGFIITDMLGVQINPIRFESQKNAARYMVTCGLTNWVIYDAKNDSFIDYPYTQLFN